MKKIVQTSLYIELFYLVLVLFLTVFLKLPSLAGVIFLVATIIISFYLDSRGGILLGSVNAVLIGGVMLIYFKVAERPVQFSQFFFTLPLFLIGGYFAGKYNEYKTGLSKRLEKERERLEKKVKERTKELEEAKSILEIKVAARTRELRKLAASLEEKVKERTKELQDKNRELEEKSEEIKRKVRELEEFSRLSIGRELKMIEFKKEINRLKRNFKKK